MQACIYEEYGPPDVVRVSEVERPEPKPGEVLVRVRASAVTTADWRLRASLFPAVFWLPGRLWLGLFRPRNPVLGMDFSGIVEATGSGVTRFQPGDRLFGSTSASSRGAHAEYVVVPESAAVMATPAFLTDEDAASVPFGANCALAFLRDFAPVKPGQRVLIVGASGNVGVWAVQLARHFGAEVTGVCGTSNAELVRSLGAHHVIDYTSSTLGERGEKYDLVFDTVGVTTFAAVKPLLTDQGVYVPLNGGFREMMQALVTAKSSGKRLKFAVSGNTRESLEQIVELVRAGVLKPVVDRVYPMAEIADAHRHVEGRHKHGSVLVAMGAAAA